MAFAHLHLHTEYSLLDGAARIKKVCARAKELGMTELAITDHGVMFGVIEFYKECKKQGIKPIIGCEAYVAAESRFSRNPEKDRHPYHLILLAKDDVGYKNLIKMISLAHIEGNYYKPRIDKELMRKYHDGLICLSACLAGSVQKLLANGDYEGAKREALEYRSIFGEDYYLEIQDQGLDAEHRILPMQKRLSEETGIPLVATNDVHYVERSDAEAHDVLLCIQTNSKIGDEDRMRYETDQFYLRSEEEMREVFKDTPEAIDRTMEIAEKCNVDFEFGHLHLPEFVPPEGYTNEEYIRELCEEGLKERYPDSWQDLTGRLDRELETIRQMGFVNYFLIVWDYVRFAREAGIGVGPGRGSAAGSIVAYVLKITNTDPIKYDLIFERFLNPERVSMPDIDIDFDDTRRGEVIDYVINKYGAEHVAQIITFGTMAAKSAIRDVARVMDVPYAEADLIAKLVPNALGMTIEKALKTSPDFAEKYAADPQAKRIIDMAMALEGMPRNTSTHAAGVVITRDPVDAYVPLYLGDKGIATQFEKGTVEELGLLKMDFLGLRNLTTIKDAIDMIRENHGVEVDFSKMEYDDPGVFRMISEGNTQGVFQLESSGMTNFMMNLRPDSLEDIIAGISLYRPGPMASIPTYIENKKHPEGIKYIHESLEPILSVTYGCMVYQEQVMQIVRDLAGYSFGRSDVMRRTMSKKKMEDMLKEKEAFINGIVREDGSVEIPGCIRNGIPLEAAEQIYDQMVSFAEYAFNKSHAAAYAIIGYETAWLKLHYPMEYMTALLSSVMGDNEQTYKYISNCSAMGIEVLPPDVNESRKKFTITGGKVRFGLRGVKHVGDGAIEAIIKAREENGLPKDIFTFVGNLDPGHVNKKAIESLIKAGATTCLDGNMAQHLAVYDRVAESAQSENRRNIEGQVSLFQTNAETMDNPDAQAKLPEVEDFNDAIKSSMEKEMLGVYLTNHPLKNFKDKIEAITNMDSARLREAAGPENMSGIKDGDKVVMAGIITAVRTQITRTNKVMAFVTIEDMLGSIEIVVFPNVYERCRELISDDSIVCVRGKLDFKEDEMPKVLADRISDLRNEPLGGNGYQEMNAHGDGGYHQRDAGSDARERGTNAESGAAGGAPTHNEMVKLRIPEGIDDRKGIDDIIKLMRIKPGDVPVVIYPKGMRPIKATREIWVNADEQFLSGMKRLLGEENVKYER